MGNFVSYENAEDLVKGIKHDIVKDLVNNKGEFDDSIAYKIGDVVQYYSDPQTKLDRRLYKFISDDYEKGLLPKTWDGLTSFNGKYIWTDGDNIYYSSSSSQYVLDKTTSTWSPKAWSGLTSFNIDNIWTDGDNIYYSYYSTQYVLDKATSTWNTKTWSGSSPYDGKRIWTDGDNIYYSNESNQYVLDKTTSTWNPKTWSGYIPFGGKYIWTDGVNVYYSSNLNQYVLDKATSTWNSKYWSGLPAFNGGDNIWTDGENIYHSNSSQQYVLNKSTSTWSTKTWSGLDSFYGSSIWTDGENIYYSYGSNQYVLDKATSTWNAKTWSGLTSFYGYSIWTDGENIYHSNGSDQYVLDKTTSTWNPKTWDGLTAIRGDCIWIDGDDIYYSNGSDQYALSLITTWNPSLVEEVTIEKLINDGDKGRPMTKKEFDALSDEEKVGLIHVTDEPDNADYIQISQEVTQNDKHAVSGDAVYNYIEIIIPPTITNYASYKNAGGNRGENITKYWKDGSLADRIDGVNGFKPFEDLYLWDYIDLDSNITAPSSGGGSTTGTKRIHIAEFNGLNNYQLNKRSDDVNFFNHLRMVTGTHFGKSKMNDTNTTEGGYLGSKMYTDIIGNISTSGTLTKQLYDQLGSILIPTTELLTNSINASGYNRFGANSGCSNNWTWADVHARLLSEIESNGSVVWSSSGYDTGNAQHQLPAFKNDKSAAYPQGIYYWLKDIAASARFCCSIGGDGHAYCLGASGVGYVRLLLTLGRKPS